MAANSANSRTRTQQKPPGQFLRYNRVTPTSQEVTGWDIAGGIVHYVARMAAEGFSVEEHSHDGHSSRIQHGDHHEAVQGRTADTTGHHDERTKGGHRNQNNGSHHEEGSDSTKAVDGSHQQASSSSAKNYTQGDGHHHMQGDQAFSVEEGGVHYNVSQDFTITASTGNMSYATNELFFNAQGSEAHMVTNKYSLESGSDILIKSQTSITLQVGQNSIVITPSGITIKSQHNITIEGNDNTIKSKTGTQIEAGFTPPLPWDGT
jgi:hypothetical protein